jgi:hypothetical protein
MGTQPVASTSFVTMWRQLPRVLLVPLLVACLGGTLESYFPGPRGFVLLFAAVVVILGWWIAGFARTGIALFRRQWVAAGGRFLAILLSVPLCIGGAASGDYMHLGLSYPLYLYQIERTSSRPVRFHWGDTAVTALDSPQWRTLIYDDTGKAAAAVGTNQQKTSVLWVSTTHLAGNFFIEVEYAR